MTQLTLRAQLEALIGVDRPRDLAIATLTRHDLPGLASLYVVGYGLPETAESLWTATDEMRLAFDGELGTVSDDSFVGAWKDGQLVGACLCVIDAPWEDIPDGPFIIDLIVDPEFRGQGIATALVGEIARRADTWGYDSLALRIDLQHASAAARLYHYLGFTELGD